eukprot:5818247-Pyramimonas_sp.AAC.1
MYTHIAWSTRELGVQTPQLLSLCDAGTSQQQVASPKSLAPWPTKRRVARCGPGPKCPQLFSRYSGATGTHWAS